MSFEVDKTMKENIAQDINQMILHGWYSAYGFKSIGMILAFIYGYSNTLRIAESVTVGDGKVTLYNQDLATYEWDEQRQIPIFEFVKSYEHCNKRQAIYLRFLKQTRTSKNLLKANRGED